MSLSSYKNTIGHPIAVSHKLTLPNGKSEIEYIQGELKDVSEHTIVIEQHFSFEKYLTKEETLSVLRTLKYKQFTLLSKLKVWK